MTAEWSHSYSGDCGGHTVIRRKTDAIKVEGLIPRTATPFETECGEDFDGWLCTAATGHKGPHVVWRRLGWGKWEIKAYEHQPYY